MLSASVKNFSLNLVYFQPNINKIKDKQKTGKEREKLWPTYMNISVPLISQGYTLLYTDQKHCLSTMFRKCKTGVKKRIHAGPLLKEEQLLSLVYNKRFIPSSKYRTVNQCFIVSPNRFQEKFTKLVGATLDLPYTV